MYHTAPPIPVSDCLILLQQFDTSPEKRKENDKNTNFTIKKIKCQKVYENIK